MAYKDGTKPQKGDAVLGSLGAAPARGQVLSWNEKTDALVLQRRSAPVFHEKSGQTIQGPLEQVAAKAADFELLYRPPARAGKPPLAVTAAPKEA